MGSLLRANYQTAFSDSRVERVVRWWVCIYQRGVRGRKISGQVKNRFGIIYMHVILMQSLPHGCNKAATFHQNYILWPPLSSLQPHSTDDLRIDGGRFDRDLQVHEFWDEGQRIESNPKN